MKLAIFDFDGTLFPKDTLPFLFFQWYHQNYSKTKFAKTFFPLIPLYLQYKTGIKSSLTREEMRIRAVQRFNQLFTNMTKQEVVDYFSKTSDQIIGLLNKSVVDEVKKAKSNGFHTVILSGTYMLLLNNIAEYLGVDTVIGTEIYFNDNLFDPTKQLTIVSGSLKIKKIYEHFHHHKIDWFNSYSYADSYSDLPLLELVGNPIVVNPDEQLKVIASNMGWQHLK